jgi:hypothetical protein
MATVQLADIIDVTVFNDLAPENDPIFTRFVESGVIIKSPLFDELANAPGRSADLPYWKDLATVESGGSEPNYSDDSANLAAPENVAQVKQRTQKTFVNNGWSSMDLARELAVGADALRHIRNRVDAYWTKQWQSRVVANTIGIYLENAGETTPDMIRDVASDTIAGQGVTTRFNRNDFVQAAFTLGDHYSDLAAILCHSTVYQNMVEQDDIDFIRDAEGRMVIPQYLGHDVIVDDGCPSIPGATDGIKHITTIYGSAAFAYGEGTPVVPTEVIRVPQAGEGGGEEQLWSRKTWLLHPLGYDNLNVTATANASQQSNAEVALAANWNRLYQRKNVPVAFLVTN